MSRESPSTIPGTTMAKFIIVSKPRRTGRGSEGMAIAAPVPSTVEIRPAVRAIEIEVRNARTTKGSVQAVTYHWNENPVSSAT